MLRASCKYPSESAFSLARWHVIKTFVSKLPLELPPSHEDATLRDMALLVLCRSSSQRCHRGWPVVGPVSRVDVVLSQVVCSRLLLVLAPHAKIPQEDPKTASQGLVGRLGAEIQSPTVCSFVSDCEQEKTPTKAL